MGLEASQTEDPLNQALQSANHYGLRDYGAVMEETCSQCFIPLTCNYGLEALASRFPQCKCSELHAKQVARQVLIIIIINIINIK